MDDIVIAEIEKSKSETLRIRLAEFHDYHFLDLRVFYTKDDGELAPTKKGVAIPLVKAADVIEGLNAGLRKAVALGLRNGEGHDRQNAAE